MDTSSPVNLPCISNNVEEITMDQFWEELYYNPKDFKQRFLRGDVQPKDDFEWYMDKISNKIHKSSGLSPEQLILFYNMSTSPPLDHPTHTNCKPDFSACPSAGNEFHWTEIEATIGIPLVGMSEAEGLHQAMSYTLFLLQARPDRVSIQGMYVDDNGVILIISSAAGVMMSPKLRLADTLHVRLLYAFVKRLYDPHHSMIDPTINRRKDGPLWVFDITVPNMPSPVECRGYRILSTPGSLGQRTHIFVNKEDPALFNNVPILVIKDQYSCTTHPLNEAEVIRHIHAEGEVPGVVHLVHAGVVKRDDNSAVSSGNDQKARICLAEYGTPFMDTKTPLEVLMTIYDLLEVTRFLYVKHQVLHHDISIGNVLHLERDHTATAPLPIHTDATTRHEFCFINHFLDQHKECNSTSMLLIDFNRGEIVDINDGKVHSEKMGTPIFMARAVQAGGPLDKDSLGHLAVYRGVPELSPSAYAAYAKVFPDRLTRFQHSPDLVMTINSNNKLWRHELRHDAESAFWLLVWWAVHAVPEEGPMTKIPPVVWTSLTSMRPGGRSWWHPHPGSFDYRYLPLEGLLQNLNNALQFDLHWATSEPFTDPEYLHEVFQRHILNFIFANQNEEFMNKTKANVNRPYGEIWFPF